MMTKKMILGLGTAALLASGALAYSGDKKGCEMKNGSHKMMKMKHSKKGNNIVKSIMRLDLTPEQREQMRNILKESHDSKKSPNNAFTAKEFNKEMFVKLLKEKRENSIERKAQTIQKMYQVLNEIQRKNLKTMLDMQELKKDKMRNFHLKGGNCGDKACNGRG